MSGRTILAAVLMLVSSGAFAQSYRYRTPVTLNGKLLWSMADPAITIDERPHRFPAIALHEPITVLCAPADTPEECEPEMGVTLLHLVLDDLEWAQFRRLAGKTVRLSGTLFHSHTGHHFTSVLMDVDAITPR